MPKSLTSWSCKRPAAPKSCTFGSNTHLLNKNVKNGPKMSQNGPKKSKTQKMKPKRPDSIFAGCRGPPNRLHESLLARSWGLLGRSWAVLERSWGDILSSPISIYFWIDFGHQKGAKREAFWEPKWSPNRSQNDSKSKSIFKSEKIPFKTVLGASWSRLGPILGHLDRACGHLGAILERFGELRSAKIVLWPTRRSF